MSLVCLVDCSQTKTYMCCFVAGVGMELNTIFHLYDKSKLSKNLQNYSGLLAGYLHLTHLEGGENAALGHRGKAGEGGLGLQFAKRHL